MLAGYEVLEKLGEGGMGVVYKARDTRLDRPVALKYLAAGRAELAQARERAVREARAIAALNHPNIATIYEIGDADGSPVLVLEYMPGETLRGRIEAGPVPLAEIVQCALQIAEGLAYAHSHGLVHGDVKLENVMFAEDGRLKIMDFGLARVHDDRTVTVDGKISGTLRYLAPECLQGWPADCQTDIFALGVVLEEMAGDRDMPEPFRTVVARATARDRSQRFRDMGELAAALRGVHEEPVHQTPTILITEDDDALRMALERGLAGEGYTVVKAANGREAIRIALETRPQLVLLDVMMPGMNGFDVCRELRRTGFEEPIIMVTGRAEEVDKVVGLEIGADDYLTKPFSQRELVARIGAHLRRAKNSCPR